MFRPLFRAGVGVPSAFSAQARSFSSTGAAAAALARINLVGNLGSAPELVNTSTGRELVRYTVGVTSGPRHDRRTSWFRVASFVPEGATRDYLLGVPKGSLVFVEGDVSTRPYEDSEGRRGTSFSIVQRSIDVLRRPRPKDSENDQSGQW